MKTNQNDDRSFIIERTDKFTESSDLFSLYDLSHVNSKLSVEEREQLLYSVKKMILTTNLFSKWKSSTIKGLLLVVHFCLFSSGLCAVMVNKDVIFDDVKLRFFLIKLCLINVIIIPFWISHFYIFKDSEIAQEVMYNLGNFILQCDSMTNKYFIYNLQRDNFAIRVTRKNKALASQKLLGKKENFINYVINVNHDFEFAKLVVKNIIPQEDVNLLMSIDTFMKKELKYRFDKLINECLVPSLLIAGIYVFFGKEKNHFLVMGFILAFFICLFIFFFQKQLKNQFQEKYKQYIDSVNDEMKNKGKYIFVFKNLLMIFTLNEKGRSLPRDKLIRYINNIILC